nr:hypothetical protein CFP56_07262 [Quercus suber]
MSLSFYDVYELSIQQPSDQSSDSSSTSINWNRGVLRKVILCYPEWTSKRIFMGDIQRSGLDLVKVARDFDNLTLPEPSTNIVLRFTYYDWAPG